MSGFAFSPDPQRTQVWACGGGTQSAAIAALICCGKLPKPDVAVIVDTEREKSSTWKYYEAVLKPELSRIGVDLVRIPKSRFEAEDLWGGEDDNTLLIPAHSSLGEAGRSKLSTFCSGKWKRDVMERYARSLGVKVMDNWIGYSCDELRRVSAPHRPWIFQQYPLIELRMRRRDCIAFVVGMGWPRPPRSSCWMCPNMRDAEWMEMQTEEPGDFALAVAFEREEVHPKDPHAFLHESLVPLDQVSWVAGKTGEMFGCASGMCWV